MLIRSLFESQHVEILQLFFDTLLSSSDLRKNEKIQYINYRTKDGVMSTYIFITLLLKVCTVFFVNLRSLLFLCILFEYGLSTEHFTDDVICTILSYARYMQGWSRQYVG